jgi:aspartate racemase
VYGLEAQGLDGRRAPRTCIKEMAAHYVEEIRRLQPEGPYSLSGYCFGGVVAFEMAQQLVAQGQRVALLALVESSWRAAAERDAAARLRSRLRRRLAFERDRLVPLNAWARFTYLLGKATTYGRERPARIRGWLQDRRHAASHVARTIRRVEQANMEAQRRYTPLTYPGRLVLFRPAGLTLRHYGDPLWGWGGLAADGIEVQEVAATRPTIVDEPDVEAVAARLREHLAKAPESA